MSSNLAPLSPSLLAPSSPALPPPSIVSAEFARVNELMLQALQDEVFPGAVLLVGKGGRVVFSQAYGVHGQRGEAEREPPEAVSLDLIYDVGSITQLVVTNTIMMLLVEQGKLKLTERVGRYIQGFSVHGKGEITIEQLLSHCAGLPHWLPFFEEIIRLNSSSRAGLLTSRSAREFVFNQIRRLNLKTRPGLRHQISDVGFIILGEMIELLTGQPLDRAAFRFVFKPLQLNSSSFIDLSMIKRRGIHPVTDMIAPSEKCSWRKRILCGEVQDDNSWAMGGVAGHAGLFMSAGDLHHFASNMLSSYRGRGGLVRPETIRQFWNGPTITDATSEENWAYGWDHPSKENGMLESQLSPRAVGMNSFTGCSLWIEPEADIDVVLMSNRINLGRSNKKINALRPELHAEILSVLKR